MSARASQRKGSRTNQVRRNVRDNRGYIRAEFNGISNMRISADPISVTANPWNTIVLMDEVVISSAAGQVYTPSALASILTAQTTVAMNVEIRVMRVAAYNISGGISLLNTYDTEVGATTSNAMTYLRDWPGRNRWAVCCYQWPRSQQNTVLDSKSEQPLFLVSSGVATTSTFVIKVWILWRPRTASTRTMIPPSLNPD